MDRILVKSRKDPNRSPFIVFQQGDGFPFLNDHDFDEQFSRDDLRFPDDTGKDVSVLEFEARVVQGLLSNPNFVKDLSLCSTEDFINDLRAAAENLTVNLYWGDSRQKFEE